MNTIEIRINGARKRIDKLNSKIARLENLIEKKKIRIANGKEESNRYPNGNYFVSAEIEWHEEDIAKAKKDLIVENNLLQKYYDKKKSEKEKKDSLPKVKAIEEFLQNWKVNTIKWYVDRIQSLDEFVNNQPKNIPNSQLVKNILISYEREILNIWDRYEIGEETNKIVEKLVSDEIDRKRMDLYCRCSEAVGIITNATGLYVSDNLSLNGIVEGEKGTAKIETIYAGGYNIQCLHFRVLIHKI